MALLIKSLKKDLPSCFKVPGFLSDKECQIFALPTQLGWNEQHVPFEMTLRRVLREELGRPGS